jgi:hypothetical protein
MDESLLLPKLRHYRWPGWGQVSGRDLFARQVPAVPRLAVGEDTPKQYRYIQPGELAESGRTFDELEEIALSNLAKRKAVWTVDKKRGGLFGMGSKPAQLVCIEEFSCERLFLPDHMAEAQRLLRSDFLHIGIPVRGFMNATPLVDPDELSEFIASIEAMFVGAPENMEAISPAVFVMQEGRVTGVIGARPDYEPKRGFPWPPLPRCADPLSGIAPGA